MTRWRDRWAATGAAHVGSYQNNFRIIGEKSGNNLLVHQIYRVTVGPDGSVKSEIQKSWFDCK